MSQLVTLPTPSTQPCCLAATCWCGPACAGERVSCFCLILLPLPMVRVLPMLCDFCGCGLPPKAAAVLLNHLCRSCQFHLSVLFMELVAYLYCGELHCHLAARLLYTCYVSTLPALDKLSEGALARRGCSAATRCVVVVVLPTICSGATGVWGEGQPFNLIGNQVVRLADSGHGWFLQQATSPVSVSVWLMCLSWQPYGPCTSAAQSLTKSSLGSMCCAEAAAGDSGGSRGLPSCVRKDQSASLTPQHCGEAATL